MYVILVGMCVFVYVSGRKCTVWSVYVCMYVCVTEQFLYSVLVSI